MLSRSVAWLLIVLAASPFTAPFSTCDLSTVLTPPQIVGQTFIERSPSLDKGGTQPPGVSMLDENQFKNVLPATITGAATVSVDDVRVSAPALRTSVVRPPLVTLRL